MLSSQKLNRVCNEKKISLDELAGHLSRGGLNRAQAVSAIRNWRRGLMKPRPSREDIRHLASGLGVEVTAISDWQSSYKYAPVSARKARLVTTLIAGRPIQDAMDLLKFTHRRPATMVDKVLKAAVADADEQQADVDALFVSEARVDDAGVRIGTKRWHPKDRGRAHPIQKKACHIHVTVSEI